MLIFGWIQAYSTHIPRADSSVTSGSYTTHSLSGAKTLPFKDPYQPYHTTPHTVMLDSTEAHTDAGISSCNYAGSMLALNRQGLTDAQQNGNTTKHCLYHNMVLTTITLSKNGINKNFKYGGNTTFTPFSGVREE